MENSSFPMLHGKSKDSIILLTIPEPVCSKLHLFANIVSMFDTLPSNAKQRDSAKRRKEHLDRYVTRTVLDSTTDAEVNMMPAAQPSCR